MGLVAGIAALAAGQSVDPCLKCGTTGYLPRYQHVKGGVCFPCKGTGWLPEATPQHQPATRVQVEARPSPWELNQPERENSERWEHTSSQWPRVGPGGPELVFVQRQLQRKFKHASDAFKLPNNANNENIRVLREALRKFVNRSTVQHLAGSYRGRVVMLHVDSTSWVCMITDPNNHFVSAWRLNSAQLTNALLYRKLGGK